MRISIDSDKAQHGDKSPRDDKIQHPFIIKLLKKLGTDEIYLNIIKDIDDKPILDTEQWEKLKTFPLKSGTRKVYLLSPLIMFDS
jgi:hypothetical protein